MRSSLLQCSAILLVVPAIGQRPTEDARRFVVWATSCSHTTTDSKLAYSSIAGPLAQSEGRDPNAPAFDWDIWVDAGDFSGTNRPPGETEGHELTFQYQTMTEHRREQVYQVQGNHDAPYYDHGPGSWFREWCDPFGENTAVSGVDASRRPFPIEGTWERYRFVAGNILFLMLSDRNDAPFPVGRGDSKTGLMGGFPAGAVTRETFEWWRRQVLDNQDKIIVTVHHHVLRDTTTGSGVDDGWVYHPAKGSSRGSSTLYYIIENDDPESFEYTADALAFESFLDEFEREHGRGAIDLWIGGHTHVRGPDDDTSGRSISERRWGVQFLQVAALTQFHGGSCPLSRVLEFRGGSSTLRARVYLHEPWRTHPAGFYEPSTVDIELRHEFACPPPIEPMSPFPEETRRLRAQRLFGRDSAIRGVPSFVDAGPSPELFGRWDAERGGRLQLVEQVVADGERDAIANKPELAEDDERGTVMRFDGSRRVRVGHLDTTEWTDLTVAVWVRNSASDLPVMRLISKDRVSEPGCFVLRRDGESWSWAVFDRAATKWRRAKWRQESGNKDWHHIVGVADSEQGEVALYFDGERVATTPWSAGVLDDLAGSELVVGADSAELRFTQAFVGDVDDVRLYPNSLSDEQVRALYAETRR
ncbi:MAG: LamG domain-containing protein [Planctomycetes bacterium]|nr:LamG domain-containing protein [Planctomycetota bacterium]